MQGIYNSIRETNHVSRVYNVAAVLYLQFMLHVMLFHMLNVVYFTVQIPVVFVQSPIWLFSVVP